MTAAPIIPAPALKLLPALDVVLAGAEVEATEAADEGVEVAEVAGVALDAELSGVLEDSAVVTTDDTLDAAEVAEEPADDATDTAVDVTEAALLDGVPLARAIEQISVVTLLVAVA
jgi:hypothetical protein